jgi:hypothetical protein
MALNLIEYATKCIFGIMEDILDYYGTDIGKDAPYCRYTQKIFEITYMMQVILDMKFKDFTPSTSSDLDFLSYDKNLARILVG